MATKHESESGGGAGSSKLLAELENELKFSSVQADKSRGDQNQYWRGRLHGAHKALDTARRCSANARISDPAHKTP